MKSRKRLKNNTWKWMAKYIKLRDAVSDHLDPDYRYVKCRTCPKVLERGTKDCQGGHYLGRGLGGGSGTYFDERNVHTQCSSCNRFRQGAPEEMELYIIEKYGIEVIEELKLKHKVESYSNEEIEALGMYYKDMYQNMLKQLNI